MCERKRNPHRVKPSRRRNGRRARRSLPPRRVERCRASPSPRRQRCRRFPPPRRQPTPTRPLRRRHPSPPRRIRPLHRASRRPHPNTTTPPIPIRPRSTTSAMRCRLTELGRKTRRTASFGCRAVSWSEPTSRPTSAMVTGGSARATRGCGSAISAGAGLLSIMAVGLGSAAAVGGGYPVAFTRRPGSYGERDFTTTTTSGGPPCRPAGTGGAAGLTDSVSRRLRRTSSARRRTFLRLTCGCTLRRPRAYPSSLRARDRMSPRARASLHPCTRRTR